MSISLLKKILPAGTILQAKESLPIRDRSCLFVHFLKAWNERMAVSKDVLHSTEMLATVDTVSRTIPKNVRRVVGPSTFSSLIGAPIAWKSDFIAVRL